MSFGKDRYVAVCQQLLVAGSVALLGVTATGALTLDIVAPDAGSIPAAPAADPATGLATTPAATPPVVPAPPVRAEVAAKPVAPKVRQVQLAAPGKAPANAPANAPAGTAQAPAAGTDLAPRTTVPPAGSIAGLPVVLTSPAETVAGFATVGAVWNHGVNLPEDTVAFQVRTERDGTWSDWQRLEYHADHAPDGAEAEAGTDRPGTEPTVVGHVDRVQLRVASSRGVPTGLEFSLIDPGSTKLSEGAAAIDTSRIPASDAATKGAPIESTADLPQQAATQSGSTEGIALSAMR
jgi:hypothetical protein